MALPIKRPDTPLANTSEPQPVSSGLQPSYQTQAQPINKFQVTADNAIQQINALSRESMPAQPQPTQPQQPQQ